MICRNYRGNIDMSSIDKFMPLVMEKEEDGAMSPIIQYGDITFLYIKYNNLYCILVCTVRPPEGQVLGGERG